MVTTEATICLVRRDGRLLLQHKSQERFGGGKWDAPGGKVKSGESPLECAVREVEEETGLKVLEPSFHGTFWVYFGRRQDPNWTVHVFSATQFAGRAESGPEGELRWFSDDRLPLDQMWPSDRCWLPNLLAGRMDGHTFEADFWFDEAADKLIDYSVRVS
ncbi:MAG: 8-oxo-dGTP diphosphatase [Chloroflexi bacterium]|nr:8-oxo-dGTP diphosphatase [Chloroflexota bacterium]